MPERGRVLIGVGADQEGSEVFSLGAVEAEGFGEAAECGVADSAAAGLCRELRDLVEGGRGSSSRGGWVHSETALLRSWSISEKSQISRLSCSASSSVAVDARARAGRRVAFVQAGYVAGGGRQHSCCFGGVPVQDRADRFDVFGGQRARAGVLDG